MASSSESVAARALTAAARRPPTLGAGRLVCVDGPAGAGKTTLAGILAARTGAPLVHMDDLYDGWAGLAAGVAQAEALLRALAAGRTGHYRRYDWHLGHYAETVTVAPSPLVVVEGVGSGAAGHADLVTVLVWVEAHWDERLRRGLTRDGAAAEPHWHRWEADQNAHFAADRTRSRADLILSTDTDHTDADTATTS